VQYRLPEENIEGINLNTDCYNNKTTVSDIIGLMSMHGKCLSLNGYSSKYYK